MTDTDIDAALTAIDRAHRTDDDGSSGAPAFAVPIEPNLDGLAETITACILAMRTTARDAAAL